MSTNRDVLCQAPLVYTIQDFLSPAVCNHFIECAQDKWERAKVSNEKEGVLSKGRTGSNCWVPHDTDAITMDVARRISEIVGSPIDHAESFQVIAYEEGQEYAYHYDAYQHDGSQKSARCLKRGGQRLKTALVYLCDVESGGQTRFDRLDIEVSPRQGTLLVFHNTLPGTNVVHPDSLHAGMPVHRGRKYAFNLWFREHPLSVLYTPPSQPVDATQTSTASDNSVDKTTSTARATETLDPIERVASTQDSPVVYVPSLLTPEDCRTIVSKCTTPTSSVGGKTIFWVPLQHPEVRPICLKLLATLDAPAGILLHCENVNVFRYSPSTGHGTHFDAYRAGSKCTKTRGQRLFTIMCRLDGAVDADNKATGAVMFTNITPCQTHHMNNGDAVCVQNYVSSSRTYARDEHLKYHITPVGTSASHYLFLYVRQKCRDGTQVVRDAQLRTISIRQRESKHSPITRVQTASQSMEPEDYSKTLDMVLDHFHSNSIDCN